MARQKPSLGCFLSHTATNATAAILTTARRQRATMRAYITATGIAFGLVAIWAALAPLSGVTHPGGEGDATE